MDIPRYRIGNDLVVLWAILNRDGTPFDMSGKVVKLYVTNERGMSEVKPSVVTEEGSTIRNIIRWDFLGDNQKVLGKHTLTVEILTSDDHRKIKRDICDAFTLVSRSESEETGGEANAIDSTTIYLSSKLDVYRFGRAIVEIGTNGNWFIDGTDTGRTALGGGPGLVHNIYKDSDFGGTFDPDSVIDTFNAYAINKLFEKISRISIGELSDTILTDNEESDVVAFNGKTWTNIPFRTLFYKYFKDAAVEGEGSGDSGGECLWEFDEATEELVSKYQVRIDNNLIVSGDTSSGGEGEDTGAEGTVIGVSVNGEIYTDVTSGILDLSDAFKNVTVDLSGYYTSAQTDAKITSAIAEIDLSPYAKTTDLDALTARVVLLETWQTNVGQYISYDSVRDAIVINHNLIVSGDTSSGGEGEDTPASGISGIIVNGTTYTDTDGDGFIDLGTIGGGLDESALASYLSANKYISANNLTTYGVATQSWVSGNYLPLTGGTISGPITFSSAAPAMILHRTSGVPYLRFGASTSSEYGEIGVNSNGDAVFWSLVSSNSAYNAWNTLIHSGNIGSYALTLGGGEISGLILPSAHNSYALGSWNQSFVSIYANLFWSGAANNNLWLIGGSYDTIGLVFAQSNDGGNTSILGKWTSAGFCVGGTNPAQTFHVLSPNFRCMRVQRNQSSGYGASIDFYNNANQLGYIGWDAEYAFAVADTSGKYILKGRYNSLNIGDYFVISNSATNPVISIVHGGYNWYIQGYQNNYLYLGQGSAKSLRIKYDGEVYCPQNLIVSGDTSSGSDIRFKDVIKNKTLKIADIAKAPLFTFKWNDRDDDTVHLGSSAQYWEKVCPWLVTGEDFKSLNYATLGVAMGISLAKKAVNHEERIKVLEKEIKRLKEEMR